MTGADREAPPSPHRSRGRRLLLGACLVVILGCGGVWAATLAGPIEHRGDLLQDWVSGRNHLAGMPLYQRLPLSVRLHTGEPYRGLPMNAHPPVAVLVFLPFALLDYPVAYRAWVILSVALLALTAWAIVRELDLPSSLLLPVGALLAASRPLEEEIAQGQFNLLLLALVTGAWMLERRQRSLGSGVLVGLAAAVKLFPGFLALYFVARRRPRGLLGLALGFLLPNAVALAWFGLEPFDAYVRDVVPASALYHESWRNASIQGLWMKLFDPQRFTLPLVRLPVVARLGALASSLAVAGLVLVGVWRARSPAGLDRAFALAVLGTLLASPLLWEHYLLLALLPLLVLGSQSAPATAERRLLIGAAVVLALARQSAAWQLAEPFLGGPVERGDQVLARPVHTLTLLAYPAYTLVAVFLFARFRGPGSAGSSG